MDLKKLRYVYEFLVEQANHWMLFPIALVVMGTTRVTTGRTKPDVLLWATCSLIPLGFFLLRILCNKIRRRVYCILLHIAVCVPVILLFRFLHITVSSAICIACVVLYLLYSLFLMIKIKSIYSNRIFLPVGIAMSVVAAMMRREDHWGDYYILALIAVMALFSVIFYIQHYVDFLSVNKSSAGFLPAKEMFRSGLGLVAGYTVFGMLMIVLLIRFEWLGGIEQSVKDFFAKIFKFVMELLMKFLGAFSVGESYDPAGGDIDKISDLPSAYGGSGLFWQLLEYIGMAAMLCGLLYVTFKLLSKLIQFLQGYLARRMPEEGEFDEEVFDYREKCDIDKNTEKKKLDLFGFLSYREQVRRLYKKTVMSSSAQVSREDRERFGIYTAREWGKKLEVSGMAELYEQARYTEQEITAADVKKMKEACKTRTLR